MEELFIETQNGRMMIDPAIAEKYKLEKGIISPFSQNRIVNKNGDFFLDRPEERHTQELERVSEDGIVEFDYGLQLSQSEIIEVSQGADSSVQ